MAETIKDKIKETASFLKARETSEKTALIATLLSFVLVLTVLILVISFVLPKTKVEITVFGPETAKAGELITYSVVVKNTGNVILKKPELVFHYSSLSLPEKNLIETKTPEDIYPNQEKTFTFKGQLFGKAGEEREVKTWLNYSTDKKPAVAMSKVSNFNTVISEVPIDLILDLPQKIPIYPTESADFTFRTRYFSSADQPLPNLKLSIDYPDDFTFKESIPSKIEEQKIEIPILEQFGRGEAEITGTFPAGYEIGKELNFEAKLFINLHGTDVLLKEDSVKTETYEPTFSFSQKINNQEKYFPYPGEKLHYEIYFKNIQETPLRDLSLTTILEGNLYDLQTIESSSGTFTKGGNSISWSGEQIPELRYLTPGEEGKIEFWVQLKEDYQPENITEIHALIKNRILLAGFETEFRNRVNSLIKITQEGYFRDVYGFFENSGSHPPEVNKTTYYTIVWKLENYYNWTENVTIKASLPTGINFRSVKATQGELRLTTDTAKEVGSYLDIPSGFIFEKPLYEELTNEEVKYLQIILKKEVPSTYPEQTPASGYFGKVTLEAVKSFQIKYKNDILEPQGIQQPTGYVDELTRLKLNELLSKGAPGGPAEVVWEIENVNPGIGALEDPWIAAFQIAFTPGIAQKGKIATLINEVNVSAKDQWTELFLSASDKALDTTLPHDSTVRGVGEVR